MKLRERKRAASGFSQVEVLTGFLIVLLAITGTLRVRYSSTVQALEADRRHVGTNLAKMLIEGWKNSQSTSYNIVTDFGSYYTITSASTGPAVPTGFTKRGNYKITANDLIYSVTLSYKNQTSDVPATLNVQVSWPRAGRTDLTRLCSLTTYMTL